METVRVLLISPLPPPTGGIATWTTILLRETQNHSSIKIKLVDVAVRWKRILNRSQFLRLFGGALQSFRDLVRIMMVLASFRPHVLHLNSSGGYGSLKDVAIMLLARMFGTAGLIHYHTYTSRIVGYERNGAWQFRAAFLSMRLANTVIVLDNMTYAALQQVLPPKKLKKIPNPIDLGKVDEIIANHKAFSDDKPKTETVHLVFVGRVEREKGVVEQVEACAQLKNVDLHLVGPVDSIFRKKLEDIAQQREEGNWLHFYGQVDNEEACRQILLSDILLLPSYYEAFPYVVLEGMAQAKPVVVCNVGAMAEMVDAGGKNSCGVCVKPQNTQSLLVGLKGLLEKPESWKDMGNRARKRVETLYSSSVVIEQLEKQWRETMKSNCRLRCEKAVLNDGP